MIVIENEWLKVSIATEGAEVREVLHKKNGLSYMWSGDSAYWGRVSPVLFPIVGRLKRDRFVLNDKTYHMSQHGFLRDVHFEAGVQTKETASFLFESEGSFKDVYPYEFKAIIFYTLDRDSLRVHWEISNDNEETMYFSVGGHPAFNVPLMENETIEDYTVTLVPAPDKKVMEYELRDSLIREKGIAGDVKPFSLTPALFANDALVYSHIDRVTMISRKSGHGIEVNLSNFPFVGLWSKYNEVSGTIAPFVCIEPWYGIADTEKASGDFKKKEGINELKAGETFRAGYEMVFK